MLELAHSTTDSLALFREQHGRRMPPQQETGTRKMHVPTPHPHLRPINAVRDTSTHLRTIGKILMSVALVVSGARAAGTKEIKVHSSSLSLTSTCKLTLLQAEITSSILAHHSEVRPCSRLLPRVIAIGKSLAVGFFALLLNYGTRHKEGRHNSRDERDASSSKRGDGRRPHGSSNQGYYSD